MGYDRLLTRDQAEVGRGEGELLGIVDRFADPHVEDDLLDARHLEPVLVTELLGEPRPTSA